MEINYTFLKGVLAKNEIYQEKELRMNKLKIVEYIYNMQQGKYDTIVMLIQKYQVYNYI